MQNMKTINEVIADIETLRKTALFPPKSAATRRSMERKYTYTAVLSETASITIRTAVSCNYVRHTVDLFVDGQRVTRYMPHLRGMAVREAKNA